MWPVNDTWGRIVYRGQWFAAFVIPFMLIIGRTWLGADGGWLVVLGIVLYGPVATFILLMPAGLTLLDGQVRRARVTTPPYTRATLVLWALSVVMILTITDQADGAETDSMLSAWTDGGFSISTSETVFTVALVATLITWVVLMVVAVNRLRPSGRPAALA